MVLSKPQYETLERLAKESGCDSWFSLKQITKNGQPYDIVFDIEENKQLTLYEGISQLWDGTCHIATPYQKTVMTSLLKEIKEYCENCNIHCENLIIRLTDKNETKLLCPNCVAIKSSNHTLHFENNPYIKDDITQIWGAVRFESNGERYCLEKETMYRLLSHNLKPDEYFALCRIYSPFNFMLHDDFYTSNGTAIQPEIY